MPTADYHLAFRDLTQWEAETPAAVLEGYARYCAERLAPQGPVIDFGTGTGGFVRALTRAGVSACGVEPSATARDTAAHEHGLHLVAALDQLPPGPWHGATAIEVIEHIPDPGWLRAVHDRLQPGGFVFVTTPNIDGLTARRSGPQWPQATNPWHIALFGPAALRQTLRLAGFECIRLVRHGPVLARSRTRQWLHRGLLTMGLHSSLRMLARKPR